MLSLRINRIKLIAVAIFAIAQYSCTEIIEMEVGSTFTRCVIYGEFTTDTTTHRVSVSRSGEFFANQPPVGISGADVTITDGEVIFPLTEDPENPGTYYTQPDAFGVPGRTYTLHVRNVDLLGDGALQSYQASSYLAPVANADSIVVEYFRPWEGWIIKAYAKDPVETEDFYMFRAYVNGELHSDTLRHLIVTDDLLFNGRETNGIEVYYFQGEDALLPGDTITAYFCGITRDYFIFVMEVQAAVRRSSPMFSGPPANPATNLNNDAVGYFTAFSVSKATVVISE
jgi:hypothetical protein